MPWQLLTALVALPFLLQPGTASALDIYENGAGAGNTLMLNGLQTNTLLDVVFDASAEPGGGVYSITDVDIITTGNLVFTSSNFSCDFSGSCFSNPNPPSGDSSITVSGTGGVVQSSGGLVNVAISGSFGQVQIVGGNFVDGAGTPDKPVSAFVLVSVIPEPATALLMGLGLLGLALPLGRD